LGAIYATLDSTIASQMVTLTSARSRDWLQPNAFSMHYGFMDEHMRLYMCLKEQGLTAGGAIPSDSFLDYRRHMMEYFNSINNNCDAQSDHGWPRDYGFFSCIRKVLNLNMTDGDTYLDCLDRAEGVMVASIQPPAGELFLGSYNYVAFLLTGAAIISMFITFEYGALATSDQAKISDDGYRIIRTPLYPLGPYSTWMTAGLSVFYLIVVLMYAFSSGQFYSNVEAQPGHRSFPNTPYTGLVSFAGFFVCLIYFGGYWMTTVLYKGTADQVVAVVERADDVETYARPESVNETKTLEWTTNFRDNGIDYVTPQKNSVKKTDQVPWQRDPTAHEAQVPWQRDPTAHEAASVHSVHSSSVAVQPVHYLPPSSSPSAYSGKATASGIPVHYDTSDSLYSTDHSQASTVRRESVYFDPSAAYGSGSPTSAGGSYPATVQAGGAEPVHFSPYKKAVIPVITPDMGRGLRRTPAYRRPGTTSLFPYPNYPFSFLGIQLPNAVQYTKTGKEQYLDSERLRGTLFHVMATMFVLADPYIWVGMITKQNSPLHETVLAVMSNIFLCRLAQLAASFFLFDMLSQNKSASNFTNERFLFIFGQLTSLSFLIVSLIHFGSASGFVFSLSQSGLWTSYYIQLFFILSVCVVEALKHLFSFLYLANPLINENGTLGKWFHINDEGFWTIWVSLHWCDMAYRILFIFVTIPVVTSNLANLNGELTTFLALSSL